MHSPLIRWQLFVLMGVLWTEGQVTAAEQRVGSLSFGWATETITPPKPVAIAGQYHTRISAEVHDPLTATALALETRDAEGVIEQTLWVSCDLVGIRRRSVDQVRKWVAGSIPDFDVRKLIISTTHTHTAPAITDANETGLHPYDFAGSWAYRIPANQTNLMHPAEYLGYLEQQIATAAIRAWKSRRPGEFSSALGHVSVARNRRAVYFDGTARLYGDTKDPGFSHTEGASDDSLDTLFFWRGGTLVGVALTLYCPSQSMEGELYLSADFWHDAREALRRRFSADLFVLPLAGASGDQSPHIQVGKNSEAVMLKGRQLIYREEIGRRIAQSVGDVIDIARKSVRSQVRFGHRTEQVRLPVWKVSEQRFAEATKLVAAGKDRQNDLTSPDYINWRVSRTMVARHELQKTDPYYLAEVHVVRLDDLAMATNPFELFNDYSTRIKARSPATHTSVVHLTADCPAYLPTERAVQGGGYSARIDDGVVGPEGGRVLVDETARMIKSLW